MSGPSLSPVTTAIIRRVFWGQLLFSSGHALTTGGFLNYFANPFFKGFAIAFAVMQITPEAAESLAIVTRWLVLRWGGRKTTWWVALLLGRVAALTIPALVYAGLAPGGIGAIIAIIALLAMWSLLQGISYTAYLSWLSDLVPDVNWGRLLARRSMAISLVTLAMTSIASNLFESLKLMTAEQKLAGYTVLFSFGGVLCLLSILPVVGLPRRETETSSGEESDTALVSTSATEPPPAPSHVSLTEAILPPLSLAFNDPPFRRFLLGCWHLSFFQGLTQTAQFQFSANVLKVSQRDYYGMLNLMLLLQIPLAAWGGWLVDRGQTRRAMVGGLFGLSLAMGCWALATQEVTSGYGPTWLTAAYVIWGGFGLVNVTQPSLALKLAPRSDNAVQLSLFRQIGGLVAALSGILGGLILEQCSTAGQLPTTQVFLALFLISGLGRATAGFWFLGTEPVSPGTALASLKTTPNFTGNHSS